MGSALSRKYRSRALAATLLAVATGYYMKKGRWEIPWRKKKLGSGKDKTNRRKSKGPSPIKIIFQKLWPFGTPDRNEPASLHAIGATEILLIFAVSMMRTWHQNRMVYVKRDLMTVTYTRNMGAFRGLMFDAGWMSVLASVIFSTHRYLKERLAALWREKLTKQLHSRYFHAIGYYKLSH